MNDLIRREDAMEAVWKPQVKPNELIFDALKRAIESEINNLPSAERPQGEWIPATWHDEYYPERLKKHKCSVCGKRASTILVNTKLVDNYYCYKSEPITEYTHKEQLSKFCPNCGAMMKGADDEAD